LEGVAPTQGVFALAPRALPPALVYVEERVGARVFVRWAHAVASALEPDRALSPVLPPAAGAVGGNEVLPPDWSIYIQIRLFEYEFDRLN
jgi:hypothetical protein